MVGVNRKQLLRLRDSLPAALIILSHIMHDYYYTPTHLSCKFQ